jgi:hypothetical protein
MKRYLILQFISLVFISLSAQGVKDDVRATFEHYKAAIMADDGPEAIKYVDQRTLDYYGRILHSSLVDDSIAVDRLGLLDKLMVLSLRYRTPKIKLLAFNGSEILIYAIESGMVGKNSVMGNTIGEVTLGDSKSEGQLVVNGNPTPVNLDFYEETDGWKVDITSIFELSETAFRQMVEESGQSENEFLQMVLDMVGGGKPFNPIWNPVKK